MPNATSNWTEKIRDAEARAAALEAQLADPKVATRPAELARLGKQLAALRPLLDAGRRYRTALRSIEDASSLTGDADPELQALAREEKASAEAQRARIEEELRRLLIPRDPADEKAAILEIRAGAGGDEAALFAADLFRMYARYAEAQGWKLEPLSLHETGGGRGIKEVIAGVEGRGAFGRLRYEKGVHRVQRVPVTESQGRIHTSTVTVAIMPEAEELDIAIAPADLRIDVFRASGPGGQSVNTTDSAVRITHEPSGVVVSCQDEKSQHKNKARALKVLRARLLDAEREKQTRQRADLRRAQVGSGERSEKIRTYNYPQNRVTDHRAGLTLHKLDRVLEGELEELLDGLRNWVAREQERKLVEDGASA